MHDSSPPPLLPAGEQKGPGETVRPSVREPGHGGIQIRMAMKEKETSPLGSEPWPKLVAVFP